MGLFSKKSKDTTTDDANRAALFGGRKASPASSTAASTNSGSQNPYGAPSPAPSSSSSGGYGGYGAPPPQQQQQQQQPGGYGGYGRSDSSSTADSKRDQLFGGAQQRNHQQQQQPPPYGSVPANGPSPNEKGAYGGSGGYGTSASGSGSGSGGYGSSTYGQTTGGDSYNRQLTAEEEEEEDVNAVKQQIRFTKQESVASTRNALRVAAQAEETGRNTLGRLGAQGERLHNTEKNLDIASSHNRVAEQKARELKTLNGSMFAVHVSNPFNSSKRAQEEERRILERHQSDREERDKTRQFGFESRNHVGKALGGSSGGGTGRMSGKMSLAERSKYQFEGDESDDEKEREIDNNLDALGAVTGRLKNLAMATSQEVDRQNAQIDKIMKKSDRVDDQIAVTHNRIKNIH
ncbi:plasma membrane snare protein-like protein [Morchella snyderi]|nr:plasma membrane snare protein-like protein [Morchella snyderi]